MPLKEKKNLNIMVVLGEHLKKGFLSRGRGARFFSQSLRSWKKSAAFTLVELLIVIGITATLSVVGVGFYTNQQKAKVLESTAQEIVNYLRYAQQKSMAQEQGLQWGVHFENPASGQDFYALFSGASYQTPLEIKYLPSGIEFQNLASGYSMDIKYEKLTGFLSGTAYQEIILQDPLGNTKIIIVCQTGITTYDATVEVCGIVDTTPPEVQNVTASNSYNSYVGSPFNLSATILETQSIMISCDYTTNNGLNWYSATLSGSVPNYTCTQSNITSSDGVSLSLNIRATSKGGTGTGTVINRTVDAAAPTASDNWTDNWTATTPVNVTISSNDARSGVAATKYCVDTPNSCYPSTSYTAPVAVSCASGSVCTQYIRYTAWDNVNNASSIYSKRVRQDKGNPTASDNWIDNWTATSPVTVTITPSDGSGSGIQTTYYCIDTANTCTPTTVGTAPSVTCAAGTNCTQYVRYYTKDNVNNVSSVYSKRVRQDKLAPTNGTLTATAGSQQVSLSWSGFSDSGSGLATSNTYKLVFQTGSSPASCSVGTQIYLGTGTSYTHTGLTNGTTYYYRVCAYDVVGNVSTGATASATPTSTCSCGPWSSCTSCSYDSTCDCSGSGTQTRTCTPSGCDVQSQSCECTRDTCSISCGTPTACSGSYSDTCDETCDGTQTLYLCDYCNCESFAGVGCDCGTRDTDGTVCGTPTTCSGSYSGTCDETCDGTQTVYTCSGGSCNSSSSSCSCGTRSTGGTICQTGSCNCSCSYSSICATTGTCSNCTQQDLKCAGGSCDEVYNHSCTCPSGYCNRDTNGILCCTKGSVGCVQESLYCCGGSCSCN